MEKVASGEEVIIGKAGKPIAIMTPYAGEKNPAKKRVFGQFKGQIWMSPDFDAEDPEILRMFGMLDE